MKPEKDQKWSWQEAIFYSIFWLGFFWMVVETGGCKVVFK